MEQPLYGFDTDFVREHGVPEEEKRPPASFGSGKPRVQRHIQYVMGEPPVLEPGKQWANLLSLRQVAKDNVDTIWAGQRSAPQGKAANHITLAFMKFGNVADAARYIDPDFPTPKKEAFRAFARHGVMINCVPPDRTPTPLIENRGLEAGSFLDLMADEAVVMHLRLWYSSFGDPILTRTVQLFAEQAAATPEM